MKNKEIKIGDIVKPKYKKGYDWHSKVIGITTYDNGLTFMDIEVIQNYSPLQGKVFHYNSEHLKKI